MTLSRRDFLRTSSSMLLFGGVLAGRRAQAAEHNAQRPNIIFFLTDDQRADLLGCAGHPIVKTPNIDNLAAHGVRFRNAFVTTSICAASRASLFTGLYERTHRYTFGTPPIAKTYCDESYPVLLRQQGYQTGFVGKFGVGVPKGYQDEMFDYFVPLNRNPYIKTLPDGTKRHVTEIAGDRAIEFIQKQSDAQPFCLSVSFNATHAEDSDKEHQYSWPKAVDGMYDDVHIPPPKLSDPAIYESQPDFLKESLNRERYFWRWDTPEKYQMNMRNYFRLLSGVDHVIGRVLDAVADRGLADNTVVIYAGDNGYYMASRGFAGKWSHYDESLRIPLIIQDPRVPEEAQGQVLCPMALNVDVAPTILALAGLQEPDLYEGRDLRPYVNGEPPDTWRDDFFCEHLMEHPKLPKWEGVRGEHYMYARYFEQDPPYEFLHDLARDPNELHNYVDDPAYQEALQRMRKRCNTLRDKYGGPYEKK